MYAPAQAIFAPPDHVGTMRSGATGAEISEGRNGRNQAKERKSALRAMWAEGQRGREVRGYKQSREALHIGGRMRSYSGRTLHQGRHLVLNFIGSSVSPNRVPATEHPWDPYQN